MGIIRPELTKPTVDNQLARREQQSSEVVAFHDRYLFIQPEFIACVLIKYTDVRSGQRCQKIYRKKTDGTWYVTVYHRPYPDLSDSYKLDNADKGIKKEIENIAQTNKLKAKHDGIILRVIHSISYNIWQEDNTWQD
jgi:hypothetical protein